MMHFLGGVFESAGKARNEVLGTGGKGRPARRL